MYSGTVIRQMNEMATAEALERDLRPIELREEDFDLLGSSLVIPNVGDAHEGWDNLEMVEELFCDTTGMDDMGLALSMSQFIHRAKTLTTEHGPLRWAIIEHGQFQCYVGAFKTKEV